MKKAIYALSADPLTRGHLNVIERALKVFDEIILGIGINPEKKYTFTLEERELLARMVLKPFGNRVTVKSFSGLLSDFAYENGIKTVIRGVRNSSDFDFEHLLKDINHGFQQGLETLLYIADQSLSHVSSSAAKELVKNQAKNVLSYVPMVVKRSLERRISGQYFIGITGEIACGKSYVAKALCNDRHKLSILESIPPIHNVDIDSIGHDILEKAPEGIYVDLRKEIAAHFGSHLLKKDGMIDTKDLGRIIFSDALARAEFDHMMFEPMSLLLRRKLFNLKGVILINCALIAEADISDIVNNEVVLVTAPRDVQIQRLRDRGYSADKIEQRLQAQLTADKKLELLNHKIEMHGFGKVLVYENDTIGTLYNRIGKEFLDYAIR